MKIIPVLLLLASSLFAQCSSTTPLTGHPRMLVNNCIPDTWAPSQYPGGGANGRLAAVVARAMTGGAANGDYNALVNQIQPNPPDIFEGTDANLSLGIAYAGAYLFYHKAGNEAQANRYASALWASMVQVGGVTYPISTIVCNSSNVCTATLSSPANPPITTTTGMTLSGITSNDWLNGCGGGAYCITPISVTDATHFTFRAIYSSSINQTYTDSTMIAVTGVNYLNNSTVNYHTFTSFMDENGVAGTYGSVWAYFYDWCYDWLVAQGLDTYARSQLVAAYWNTTIKLHSSGFGDNVRESDFHNHGAWDICATLELGAALYGDDPVGSLALSDGMGYFWQGISVVPDSNNPTKSYIYNLSVSDSVLTGGGMNWEGPGYWREAATNFVRAIEAYDTATARNNNIWGTRFPDTKNAGWYKLYSVKPDTALAPLGDIGNTTGYVGRDNFGLVIINDRFPDAHFTYWMTTSPFNDWNSGGYGETGLILKLIFFPYVNGPGTHNLTDLPLSRQFGPDIFVRSGWDSTSSYFTYTGSLRGTYHRHEDAGTFTLFSNGAALVPGEPYQLVDPAYTDYLRRTIGANTLTVYDPNDCWADSFGGCGSWYFPLANDGGQLKSDREWYPQFPGSTLNGGYAVNRIWSATAYTDPRYSSLYNAQLPIARPTFASGAGYEHISHDLSPLYANAYNGMGYNPTLKTPVAPGSVTRDVVHFQSTLGSLNPWIVFDRVTSTNASFQKAWNIHTVNAPAVNGALLPAGDTTIGSATVTRADNGSARMFISHLLPASAKVRAVGGNSCPGTEIQGASNANPAVFYAPSHGLSPGEPIGMATGVTPDTGGGPPAYPAWYIDRSFGTYSVGSVVDADHFTVAGMSAPTISVSSIAYGNPTVITWGSNPGPPSYFASGTVLNISGATCAVLNGNQTITVSGGTASLAVNSSSCSGAFDGTVWIPWTTAFTSGNGAPAGSGQFTGQMYYQLDATPGNTVWQANYGAWQHVTGWIYASSSGIKMPDIYSHASCNYAYTVDQYGPAGSPGAHLWSSALDLAANYNSNWRVTVAPAASQTQDYFLNVVEPVTTSQAAAPATTLISGDGVYGAQVTDAGGSYVAVFPVSPTAQSSLSYSAAHNGIATHVVAGLAASTSYAVIQSGTVISSGLADSSGAFAFTETGGGTFQVYYQPLAITTPSSLPACTIGVPCVAVMRAIGGGGSNAWSLADGNLPPGIVLSAAGSLSGVPATAGMFRFTATVTDAKGNTANESVSLQVQPIADAPRMGGAAIPGRIAH